MVDVGRTWLGKPNIDIEKMGYAFAIKPSWVINLCIGFHAQHKFVYCPEIRGTIACSACDSQLASMGDYVLHMRQVHGEARAIVEIEVFERLEQFEVCLGTVKPR